MCNSSTGGIYMPGAKIHAATKQHVSYLKEYKEVLLGQRKAYSSALMSKQGIEWRKGLLRSIFEQYRNWTPEQIRDLLTPALVTEMKLWTLINSIPCPAELDRKKELYYVAWYLYPETRNMTDDQLTLKLHADILNGQKRGFPRGYFDGDKGCHRAHILFCEMIEREFPRLGITDNTRFLYEYFASCHGKGLLRKYKLMTALCARYDSPLEYLHDFLPPKQKDDDLFKYYASHKYTVYMPKAPMSRKEQLLYSGGNSAGGGINFWEL